MLRIFRNLRKSLLSGDNFRKYIFYAVGEILLVMIGILLALQVNNWNEDRKANLEEQEALINIQRDFQSNISLLDTVIIKTEQAIKLGMEILNHTGSKPGFSEEADFNRLLNGIFNLDPYYPQNGFLDDLVSSGKLGIFKSDELRNLLSSWYSILEIQNMAYVSANADEDLIQRFVIQNGSWLNADDVLVGVRDIHFPQSGFKVDNRDLLKILEFENLIENQVMSLHLYLTKQKNTMALIEEIMKVLSENL